MKKTIHLIAAVITYSLTTWAQQPQMEHWYVAPQDVLIPSPGGNPISAGSLYSPALQPTPVTTSGVANGVYDNQGKVIFYIADAGVYDYNHQLIGMITPTGPCPEIAIVPIGNNDISTTHHCQNKYNVFTTAGGLIPGTATTVVQLVRSVVDMTSYSVTSSVIDATPSQQEYGALAAGTMQTNGDRYLYFMAATGNNDNGGQLHKLVIYNDGSVSTPSVQIAPYSNQGLNLYAGIDLLARELDLSPDGKWLAWGSYANHYPRNHFIELNASGDNISTYPYPSFDIPATILPGGGNTVTGFRGVEFRQAGSGAGQVTQLFMGAGWDGVWVTDIPHLSYFNQVTGSYPDFGFSQIEYAHDGNMYVSSALTANNVGGFNPAASFPLSITPAIMLATTPNSNYTHPPGYNGFYTLPDQIDGEDYSVMLPTNTPTTVTVSSYNCSTGTAITWNNSTSPWNPASTVQVMHELRISANTTTGAPTHLTIDAMIFKFSPTARVIIEPGSSLTLNNNASLTSDYDPDNCPNHPYIWQGVEVWGDRNASQFNPFSPNAQGKLTLINNSRIEFAEWGARNCNSVTNTSTGGIINVNGGTFLNCRVDVEFNPYRNYTLLANGTKVFTGNRSSFYNCTFTTNDFYPFATPPFNVTINNCNGINFNNCTFNIDPSLNLLSSRGIKSRDGGFHVVNCAFHNFRQGVEAYRISRNEPVTIWKSNFIDNQTSIVLRNINNARVQRCTLDIGGYTNPNFTTHVGLLMQNTSGFIIEENLFRKSSNLVATSIWGTNTINSGSADNEIYNNTFTELNNGNVAGLINRDNSNAALHGLQYICNKFDLNSNNDIYIYPLTTGTTIGIRTNQGTIATSAGNTFLNTGNNSINNNTTSVLTYYHSPTQTIQNTNGALTLVQAVTKNSCPSRIGSGDIIIKLNVAEIQFLNSAYDSAETAYLNLLYSYNQLMDGGSTNALLNQIQQSWSADAWVLRNQLLAQSPYLSQTILREVALGNILPQAMLLTVSMANPDATMDEPFLYFLQNEIPNPLPQYMIDAIIASWDVKTARTTMENKLAHYSLLMATTSDKLLADLYFRTALDNDSIVPTDTTDYDITIRYWLQRVQTLTAKYDLIENYFGANELTAAQSVLDSIPGQFNLSQDQLTAYNDYIWFYTFRKNLAASNGNLAQLSVTQINELIAFTEGKNNFAKGLAQNILCHYYNHCTEEDYDLTSGGNRMFQNQQKNTNLEINNVSAAPNPATTFTTFSYLLPLVKADAILYICDITGKEITHITLKNNEGQEIWDTRNIDNGIYYFYVKEGNTKIAKGKVAVQK